MATRSTPTPALRRINLLPRSYQRRTEVAQLAVLAVLGVVLGLGATAACWALVGLQVQGVQDQQKVALDRNTSRAQSLEKQRAAVSLDAKTSQKVALLNQWSTQELRWASVLGTIAKAVNKDVRLTQLLVVPDPLAPTTLKITTSGEAPSNVSFAEYVEALRSNTELKGVSIDAYSYNIGIQQVSFSISYSVPVATQTYTFFKTGGAK